MSHSSTQAGSSGAVEFNAAPKTVLIVDDEEALRRVLALVLEDEGYRVLTARNGRSALEACRQEAADLVITDYMMPEMSGDDLIAALRQIRPRLPVIVMSSLEEDIVARACVGYTRFFRKPFDVSEFLRSVGHLASASSREHLRVVK